MIYVVEDDSGIRDLIIYTLKNTGFEAKGFENGEQLKKALEKTIPKLIMLDIMLPGVDGITILKTLRNQGIKIPVIMVTAKNNEYDKVIGLDSGADDYITKPFGMMEMISRIKAVLRRSEIEEEHVICSIGNVTLNAEAHLVFVDDQSVDITVKEFKLLHFLMKNVGIVLTRDTILEKIWGYDFDGETRTVDVHIRSLRSKLGASGEMIETVRGVGYRIGHTI